ncbi:MAG: phosphomannose isomerase type II C-terminal cupin domain [Candidatus Deferrimicrobiota bacterium]|jgi:mannose-6-phosphate isomerase
MRTIRDIQENHRPWGYYVVLSESDDCKVKRIVVHPGKRLSLQRHRRRSEHWHFVKGEGLVTRDGEQIPVKEGDSLDIPLGSLHRIRNLGQSDLVVIEVQRGEYFGEDDIERVEDDFGRS